MITAVQFNELRATNCLGEMATAGKLGPNIFAAVNDEGWHSNEPRTSRTWICAFMRASATAAVGLADRRSNRLHHAWVRGSLARHGASWDRLAPLPQVLSSVRMNWSSASAHDPSMEMRIAAIEHKSARPRGILGGEQDRNRRAFGGAQQHRASAARGVHDGTDVVHARLEAGQMIHINPVTETGPTLVE